MPGTLMLQDQSASGITMKVPMLVALDDGHTVPIDQPVILIGRSKRRAHVRIDDPYVSSVHCEIHSEDDGTLHVRDRSRHGTRINGRIVEEAELLEGDILQIIKHRFRIEMGAAGFERSEEHLIAVIPPQVDPDHARFGTDQPRPPRRPSAPVVRDNWFVRMAGVELGPMPWSDVVEMAQNHEVTEADEVRPEAGDLWTPAGTVSGLFDAPEPPTDEEPAAVSESVLDDDVLTGENATWIAKEWPTDSGMTPTSTEPNPGGMPGAPIVPPPAVAPPAAPVASPQAPPIPGPALPTAPVAAPPSSVPTHVPLQAPPAVAGQGQVAAPPPAVAPQQFAAPPTIETPPITAQATVAEALPGAAPPPADASGPTAQPATDSFPPSLADSSSDVALIPELPDPPEEDSLDLSMPADSPVLTESEDSADDAIDLDVSDDLSEAEQVKNEVQTQPAPPSLPKAEKKKAPDRQDQSLVLDYVPDPDNPKYFMRRKGRTFGPLEFEKLQRLANEGRLSQLDAIRTDSNPDWVSASTVDGLFGDDNSHDLSDEGYAASLLAEMDSSESGEPDRPFIPEPETTVPSAEAGPEGEFESTLNAQALATLPPLPVPKARDDKPRKVAVDVLGPLLYLQTLFQTWPRVAVAGGIVMLIIYMMIPTYSGSYVFGNATLNGRPLKDSSITLTNARKGIEVAGLIDEDGDFVVTTYDGGMIPGKYAVSFMPLQRESPAIMRELQRQYRASQGVGGALQQYQELDTEDPLASRGNESSATLPPGVIPFKYRSPDTTDQFIEVIDGRNEFDFELVSK